MQVLTEKIRNILLYPAVFFFLAVNLWLMTRDIYVMNLLPVLLLLVVIAFTAMDKLLLIIVFFTPLSIQLKEITGDIGFDLSLPTEPLLAGLLILFVLKLIREKSADMRIIAHPVAITIYIYLLWLLITSITSSIPLVSFKFLIARIWFIGAYFFVAAHFFRKHTDMKKYLWAYIIPFVLVIFYTLYNHSQYGLINQQASHSAVRPFYNDHTAYGAALAMILPVLAGFFFTPGQARNRKLLMGSLFSLFLFAVLFSYTRATWVSLAVAFVFYLIVRFRVPLITLVFATLVALAFLNMYRTEIYLKLRETKETSSTDFAEHVRSISNITSDASNAERINRWKSALRMFGERPLYGWGPGTYQFQYARFQMQKERTWISTNFGDLGNAHSEYIGPMAETGFPGLLTFLGVAVALLVTGLRVYRKASGRETRLLSLVLLVGLVTYLSHGLLNNFLDTDKASALFWGYIAMLVAMDVRLSSGSSGTAKIQEDQ